MMMMMINSNNDNEPLSETKKFLMMI